MKKIHSILLILIAASIVPADVLSAPFGTTGTLAGRVVDARTKEPMVGVNIVIVNSRLGGTTNGKGEYKIFNIPAGRRTVQYSYIGYKKYTVENVSINADLTTTLNVALEQGELALEEIVVTAERMLLKKDVTGTSHVVEMKQVELLPVDNFIDIIKTLPGVTRDLHIRGGRKTEILYLIDGLPFTEAAGGAVGGMLPKSAVLEMNILTGGFDPEYGNAMSGVVNIVTRRGSDESTLTVRGDIDHFFGSPETNRDNLVEFTAGGPLIFRNASFFTATDYRAGDTRWAKDFYPFFNGPITRDFNTITKVDFAVTSDLRLNAQVIASRNKTRDYEFRWRRNLTGLQERTRESYRVSVGLSQFLTDNTFYNVNISRYHTASHLGPENAEDLDLTNLYQYDLLLRYVTSGTRLWWADENQTQFLVKTDLTSQYTENNSVKIGAEVTLYDMDISREKHEPQTTYFGKPLIYKEPLDYSTSYRYKPRSGAAYLQNKFTFADGATLSIGARWDFLDPRASRPNLEWVPVGNNQFQQQVNAWVPAKVKQRISPRFGFAMPVSEHDYFFVNLGYFYQVPLFDYLYSGLDINLKKGYKILVGNPDMKPQLTKAWEFSYRRQIGEDITLKATVFNKSISNLVDTKTFLASDSKALDDGYYAQYINNPYATSKGLELTVEKHSPGVLFGRLSYTYMNASGFSEQETEEMNYIQWGFDPVNTLHPLSWDQRHTVNAVVSSNLPRQVTLDVLVNYHSPRPYTYYPSRDGFTPPGTVLQPNNKRMKHNLYIDLKATKTFRINARKLGTWRWTAYCDVRNILDRQNLLWVDSSGVPGGELHDPGAYDMPRRTHLGLEISFR